MQPRVIGGTVLIVLGIVALCVRSVTYFSHDQVAGPLGIFAWDVSQPHTIFINPIAGLLVIGIGVFLLMGGRRMTGAW
jgi:hypothetical protein